ncbi:ATP-binding protein, partial [bacterium]|nr:ATP-binding protein [bacterium]
MTINIDILLEGGENQYTEFKSVYDRRNPANPKPRNYREIAKDIAVNLAEFANADGGTLLLGVEDDG